MAILVCGGAGYIGSHAVHALVEKGEQVVIVDNLQTGHRGALNPAATFYEGDIRDAAVLDKIFTENKIEAVIHFAANSLVGESVEKPLLYFNNNVYGMQVLLEAMVRHGIDKILDGGGLRRAEARSHSRGRRDAPDESVRRDKAHDGEDDEVGQPCERCALCLPALLQCGGGAPRRLDR